MTSAPSIIADINRIMDEIPPLPVFAACRLFPSSAACRFTHDGKKYIVAHPDFWDKVPSRQNEGIPPLWNIEIVDIDISANAHIRAEVLNNYAHAIMSK